VLPLLTGGCKGDEAMLSLVFMLLGVIAVLLVVFYARASER
jgi:hypothetical protein